MENDASTDLDLALRDVRASYRLIYAFQRRTNEIAGLIAKALDGAGLEFQRWDPAFFSRPCRSSTPYWSDHWTWDMLPGFALTSVFETPHASPGLQMRAVVQFIADTGFEKRGGEPDPGQFESAEESSSVIQWSLVRSASRIPAYPGLLPLLNAAGDKVYDGTEHHLFGESHDLAYSWQQLDLALLPTSADVQTRWVRPVLDRIRSGYPSR